MSRTWDFLSIEKPLQLPHIETIVCEASVLSISETSKVERDGEWHFVIGPTYFSSPCVKRKLCLSKDKNEKLDFTADLAGEVKIKGEIIYLFLEKRLHA